MEVVSLYFEGDFTGRALWNRKTQTLAEATNERLGNRPAILADLVGSVVHLCEPG